MTHYSNLLLNSIQANDAQSSNQEKLKEILQTLKLCEEFSISNVFNHLVYLIRDINFYLDMSYSFTVCTRYYMIFHVYSYIIHTI